MYQKILTRYKESSHSYWNDLTSNILDSTVYNSDPKNIKARRIMLNFNSCTLWKQHRFLRGYTSRNWSLSKCFKRILSWYSHQFHPRLSSFHLLEHLFASSPEFFSVISFPSGYTLKFIYNTEKLCEGWVGYRGKFHVDLDVLNLDENSLKIFKIQYKLSNSFLDIYVRKMPAMPTCIPDVSWTYR